MSNNFIIGIGGSGSRIVDLLVNSNKYNSRIFSLIIDTDLEELKNIRLQNKIALTKNEKVNDVVERLGADNIKNWFSVDNDSNKQFLKMLDMHKGAHLWRNNALLAFVDFISDVEKMKVLTSYIDEFFEENDIVESDFYLVSSLCGGTGSGLILPVSYYVTNYIKEKYNKKIKFNYILTCPDIYINKLSEEIKTKCYANSYATLQEINSILQVANGYNKKALKENKTIIDYKLYLGDSIVFDSLQSKYYSTNALPFNQVYLFDKIPSINGALTHETIISSELLFLLVDDKNDSKLLERPFNSIFTTKLSYVSENNVDYIISRKTYDDITKQWLYFYNIIKEKTKLNGSSEYILKNNIELEKTLKIISVLDKLSPKDNLDEVVLNRNLNVFDQLIKYNQLDENYMLFEAERPFLEDLNKRCNNIDLTDLMKIINEPLDIEAIKLFDSKEKVDLKKKKFIDEVNKLNDKFDEWYSTLITQFYNCAEEYLQNNLLPTIKKLVMESDTSYVHPMIAFIRIMKLYRDLSMFLNRNVIVTKDFLVSKENKIKISKEFYNINRSYKQNSRKEYRIGTNRLLNILESTSTNTIKNINDDYFCVKKEIELIAISIKESMPKYYYHIICEYLEKLICKYNDLFDNLDKFSKVYSEKIENIKLKNNYNTPLHENIGTLVSDKLYLYNEFCKTRDNYEYDDSLAGKLVYDIIFDENNVDENLNVNEFIFNSIYNHYNNKLENNKVISLIKNSNILQIIEKDYITDEIKNIKNIKRKLSNIVGGIMRPLSIQNLNSNSVDNPVVKERFIISQKLHDYIIQNKNDYNIVFDDEGKIIDEFLYQIGSSKHFYSVNNCLNENDIIITHEIFNMPLYWFNKTNDFDVDNVYFNKFLKILSTNKVKLSELWNPYILKSSSESDLLFLNPAKQAQYEEQVSKAFLWLLINQKFSLDQDKDDELNYYINLGEYRKVLYDKEKVNKEEIDKLIRYIKKDYSLVLSSSNNFDQYYCNMFRQIRASIDSDYFEKSVENAIIKSKLMSMLTDNYYNYIVLTNQDENKCLIQMLFEASVNNENNKYPTLIIKHIAKIIKEQIKNYTSESEVNPDTIFKNISKSFIVSISDYVDDIDKLAEISKWIKKNFC